MKSTFRWIECKAWALLVLSVGFALLTGPDARACSEPVYKYAAENWQPEPYVVVLFRHGKPAADDEALSKLISDSHANAMVDNCDVDTDVPQEYKAVWDSIKTQTLPQMAVLSPSHREAPERGALWSGAWNKANIEKMLNSPVRKKLAENLKRGDAGVWLLFDGGKKATDDTTMALLEKNAKELSARFTAEIRANSEMVKDEPRDPAAPEAKAAAPAEDVRLSVIRVSRKEATDDTLFSGMMAEPFKQDEPCAMMVFGRGRALGPLAAKELTEEGVESVAGFLAGPCVCSIKEQKIGIDLLLDLPMDSHWKPPEFPVDLGAAPPLSPLPVTPAAPATTPAPVIPAPLAATTPPAVAPAPAPVPVSTAADTAIAPQPVEAPRSLSGLTLAAALIAVGLVALILATRKGSA